MTIKDRARAALRAAEQEQDPELQSDLLIRVIELQQEAIRLELQEKQRILSQLGIIALAPEIRRPFPED